MDVKKSVDAVVPRLEILEITESLFRFRLLNVDTSVANGLRRSILDDVPSLAIEMVQIHENTTTTNDDKLAHRLGLIPINSANLAQVCPPEDCICEDGCDKCLSAMTLNVKNTGNETRMITTKHLVPQNDHNIVPCCKEEILLVELAKNQQLSLTAWVARGTGKDNAKWNPAVIASYRPESKITIDESLMAAHLTRAEKQQIVDSCPSKVFEYDAKLDRVVVARPDRCTLCLDCVECAGSIIDSKPTQQKQLLKVEPSKTFIFVIETNGSLTPQEILRSSIDCVIKRLSTLKENIIKATVK